MAMRRSRAARLAVGLWPRRRFIRRSTSTDTAIELSHEELVARNRVLAEIERTHLIALADTDSTEGVGRDFTDVNQKLEELRTIEAIQKLSAFYKSHWKSALSLQTIDGPNRVEMTEATSQLLKQLDNFKERIESEHFQSLNLLDNLHVRRAGLEEERSKLNSLISSTMEIAEKKASSRQ